MAYEIKLISGAFNGDTDLTLSQKVLAIWLDALYKMDVEWLKAHPETPGIYDCAVKRKEQCETRVRYEKEPLGQEDWKDIPTCLRDGVADCEDLACWRAAELTVRHKIAAKPVFKWQVLGNGSYLYHIIVRYPDGRTEDPSRKLGMGSKAFG